MDYFAIHVYLHGSLITGYASMDPKDSVIMRLACITSAIGTLKCPGPEVIKHMLSSAETKIHPAHKYKKANNCWYRLLWSKPGNSIYLGYFGIYEQFKFYAQLS